MKTLTLFFLIVFTTVLTVNAQITKGNWMVGGSANFTNSKAESKGNGFTSKSKVSGFNISPNLGYFIADQFALGLTPSLSFSNPEGENNNSTSYGIGPFFRYQFLDIDKKINILAETSYRFGKVSGQSTDGSKSNSFQFKAGPVIYFNSSVGLELTVDYDTRNIKNGSGSETSFSSFNISIGFQIHLEKQQ